MPPHYLRILLEKKSKGCRTYRYITVQLGFLPRLNDIRKLLSQIKRYYKGYTIKKYWIRSFHRGAPDFVYNLNLEEV